MNSFHKEQIGNILLNLVKLKREVGIGWNDKNSNRFFLKNLEPLEQNIHKYHVSADKYFDQLHSAMSKINSLVGSSSPFPIDPYQHIRER